MRKIIAISVLLLLTLCFLHSGILEQLNHARANDYYIPEKKWMGLETTDYDSIWGKELISGMMTGTPDPVPEHITENGTRVDASVVSCEIDQRQISLQKLTEISVVLTHTMEDGEAVPVYKIPNLERWNGTEWERLIYLPFQPSLDGYEPVLILPPGETVSISLRLEESITRLTVGKYRAVIYAGYENENTAYAMLYAEFELTE